MMRCGAAGTVVNPSSRLAAEAELRGWEILRPAVPWKGKVDKAARILRFAAGI